MFGMFCVFSDGVFIWCLCWSGVLFQVDVARMYVENELYNEAGVQLQTAAENGYVNSVWMVYVCCTRDVTSSTDHSTDHVQFSYFNLFFTQ